MARKISLLGAAALTIIAGLILWRAGLPHAVSSDPSVKAELVPEFSVRTLDGTPLTIKPGLGHPMLINFWATWCVPCNQEMPMLQRLSDMGVSVVGINAGAETPEAVKKWLQENDVTFTVIMDEPDNTLERLFRVPGLPTTFFVDADGTIQKTVYGALTEQTLQAGLGAIGVE